MILVATRDVKEARHSRRSLHKWPMRSPRGKETVTMISSIKEALPSAWPQQPIVRARVREEEVERGVMSGGGWRTVPGLPRAPRLEASAKGT